MRMRTHIVQIQTYIHIESSDHGAESPFTELLVTEAGARCVNTSPASPISSHVSSFSQLVTIAIACYYY